MSAIDSQEYRDQIRELEVRNGYLELQNQMLKNTIQILEDALADYDPQNEEPPIEDRGEPIPWSDLD